MTPERGLSNVPLLDVLHLYLGCRVRATWENGDVAEFILETMNTWYFTFGEDLTAGPEIKNKDIEIDLKNDKHVKVQLFLTNPLHLTPQQKAEYKSLCHKNNFHQGNMVWETDTPESILWLLKNQVDAFDLIARGLAIEKLRNEVKPKKWYPHKKIVEQSGTQVFGTTAKQTDPPIKKASKTKIQLKENVEFDDLVNLAVKTPKKVELSALEKLDKLYKEKEEKQRDDGSYTI